MFASVSWRLDDDGETVLWWRPKPTAAEAERRLGMLVTADRWEGQIIEVDGLHIAPHIARWDPSRVLAEVAARRTELDLIEYALDGCDGSYLADQLARMKARPYADHPDFDPAWRVD